MAKKDGTLTVMADGVKGTIIARGLLSHQFRRWLDELVALKKKQEMSSWPTSVPKLVDEFFIYFILIESIVCSESKYEQKENLGGH